MSLRSVPAQRHVIVIGGGFAGLSAAVELCRVGLKVTVLEQKPELGGRAYSFFDEKVGDTVDNGQHLMMGCYHHTLAFLETIGAADRLVFQPNMEVKMIAPHGLTASLRAARLPGPAHMIVALARYEHLSRRERLALLVATVRMLAMYRLNRSQLERITVRQLMDMLGQSANARQAFWYPLSVAALNEDPELASAALLAEVVRRGFFGSRRNSAFVYARVGLSELYCEPSRRFIESHGGKVVTHCGAAALEINGDARVIGVRLRDGQMITGDFIISAVPWTALMKILPATLTESPYFSRLTRLSFSPIVCAHLWFDRPVTDVPFVGFIGTTTQWLFNKEAMWLERRRSQLYQLSFIISGARNLLGRNSKELLEQVQEDLVKMIPEAQAARLVRALVIKEKQATLAPWPESFALRPSVDTPISNLYLAGDWVQTGLPATIESAVASGHKAAHAIIARVQQ